MLGLDVQDDAFLVLAVALAGQFGEHVLLNSEDVVEFEYGFVFADLDEQVLRLEFLEEVLVVDVSDLVEFSVFAPAQQVLLGVVEHQLEAFDPHSFGLDKDREAVPLSAAFELRPPFVDELDAAISQLLPAARLPLPLDLPLKQQLVPEHLEFHAEDHALGAEVVLEAVAALGMAENVVGVEVDLGALVADEGLVGFDHIHVVAAPAAFLRGVGRVVAHLAADQILVDLGPVVQRHPDAAEFSHRPELRPLQLIDVVVERIALLYEVRGMRLYRQLYLAEDAPVEPRVYQNIVGAVLEPVLYAHYSEGARVLLAAAEADELVVDADDFLLAGGQFAAHEVSDFEGEEVGRAVPVALFGLAGPPRVQDVLVEALGHQQDAVDHFVQVFDYLAVQVLYYLV